ncbi:hypothetical protein CTI12_AA523940 [Artemisia annua]|uniref:Uncharacterized protein n=1 Tax=Artemisia annua TaxID=35608 RepID=A0A2U1L6Y7_ARTAN|nr:hypothetical protein CTI12_AA523940 [Artemisia annua]
MRGFPGLLLILLLSSNLCYGIAKTVEVVGFGECADCKENNIKTSQALSGLMLGYQTSQVVIDMIGTRFWDRKLVTEITETFINFQLMFVLQNTTTNRTTGEETFGGDTNVPAESRYTTKTVLSWHTTSLTDY